MIDDYCYLLHFQNHLSACATVSPFVGNKSMMLLVQFTTNPTLLPILHILHHAATKHHLTCQLPILAN